MHNQCENHHIASDKAHASENTDQYKEYFKLAGVDLQYEKNIIPLEGHRGGHTKAYKKWVLDKLKKYINIDNTKDENKVLLDMILEKIAEALYENPRLPYSDGKQDLDNYNF